MFTYLISLPNTSAIVGLSLSLNDVCIMTNSNVAFSVSLVSGGDLGVDRNSTKSAKLSF